MVIPDCEWAPWYADWQALCEKSILLADPVYLDTQGRIRPKPRWDTRIGILNGQRQIADRSPRKHGAKLRKVRNT